MIRLAMTVHDLLAAIDYNTERKSHHCSPNIIKFDNKNGIIDFVTRCSGSRNAWYQKVKMEDYDIFLDVLEEDEKKKIEEVKNWDDMKNQFPDVLKLDVRVDCGCPAFLYWGSRYTLSQLDSSIEREDRFPGKRDPDLDRILCKHLITVFRRYF